MSKSDSDPSKSVAPSDQPHISSQKIGQRPAYFLVGRAGGCDLVASVRTHTVHVVDTDAGRVVHQYVWDARERTLDEFVAAYDDAYGFDERLYGGLSGMVERALGA
ncbi:hypothetical protein [Halosegnis longus]|uniref:hypothetical protein n=1 Tax=Halosegnis longus TaxID=2216012 RepID=UPI00129EF7AA|nr:hypothetical protein [Halosegnis longus]